MSRKITLIYFVSSAKASGLISIYKEKKNIANIKNNVNKIESYNNRRSLFCNHKSNRQDRYVYEIKSEISFFKYKI